MKIHETTEVTEVLLASFEGEVKDVLGSSPLVEHFFVNSRDVSDGEMGLLNIDVEFDEGQLISQTDYSGVGKTVWELTFILDAEDGVLYTVINSDDTPRGNIDLTTAEDRVYTGQDSLLAAFSELVDIMMREDAFDQKSDTDEYALRGVRRSNF